MTKSRFLLLVAIIGVAAVILGISGTPSQIGGEKAGLLSIFKGKSKLKAGSPAAKRSKGPTQYFFCIDSDGGFKPPKAGAVAQIVSGTDFNSLSNRTGVTEIDISDNDIVFVLSQRPRRTVSGTHEIKFFEDLESAAGGAKDPDSRPSESRSQPVVAQAKVLEFYVNDAPQSPPSGSADSQALSDHKKKCSQSGDETSITVDSGSWEIELKIHFPNLSELWVGGVKQSTTKLSGIAGYEKS